MKKRDLFDKEESEREFEKYIKSHYNLKSESILKYEVEREFDTFGTDFPDHECSSTHHCPYDKEEALQALRERLCKTK